MLTICASIAEGNDLSAFIMTSSSSYILYQSSAPAVKRDPSAIVTATDLNIPGFPQKPYDPFSQNDTTSSAAFQPPPPTRRPPPVPVQQPGMTMSGFPQRALDIAPTASMESPAISQPGSGNGREPLQGRNNSVTQGIAATNGANEADPRSPGIFAALLGRAPRMTKSRPSFVSPASWRCILTELQMESSRRNGGPRPIPSQL